LLTFQTSRPAHRLQWRLGRGLVDGFRAAAEETPIAIVHDGSTTAVMMATPSDLEDFALGFSLSEGIVSRPDELRALDIVEDELGVELRVWLEPGSSGRLASRRRLLVGPTGCGLCGVESLVEAMKAPKPIKTLPFIAAPEDLLCAIADLEEHQSLARETHAVHAAGLWSARGRLTVREDVGRHNALDKLIGAVARGGVSPLGVLVLTSRVSVEMVQKAAVLGAPIVCAVSAPTALAIRVAEASNLTLVAVARHDGFEVFSHPERLVL
jgi:FdhD protein